MYQCGKMIWIWESAKGLFLELLLLWMKIDLPIVWHMTYKNHPKQLNSTQLNFPILWIYMRASIDYRDDQLFSKLVFLIVYHSPLTPQKNRMFAGSHKEKFVNGSHIPDYGHSPLFPLRIYPGCTEMTHDSHDRKLIKVECHCSISWWRKNDICTLASVKDVFWNRSFSWFRKMK